jgi:hypothetical protein
LEWKCPGSEWECRGSEWECRGSEEKCRASEWTGTYLRLGRPGQGSDLRCQGVKRGGADPPGTVNPGECAGSRPRRRAGGRRTSRRARA